MVIPSSINGVSVTKIGDYAFSHLQYLMNITIPNSVTSIGDWAFYDCGSLSSVTIPNSVKYIYGYAFSGCSSLNSAYFEGDAPVLGAGAFEGTASDLTVYFMEGAQGFTTPTWHGYPCQKYLVDPPSDITVISQEILDKIDEIKITTIDDQVAGQEFSIEFEVLDKNGQRVTEYSDFINLTADGCDHISPSIVYIQNGYGTVNLRMGSHRYIGLIMEISRLLMI